VTAPTAINVTNAIAKLRVFIFATSPYIHFPDAGYCFF
jgi:hypothetical protein